MKKQIEIIIVFSSGFSMDIQEKGALWILCHNARMVYSKIGGVINSERVTISASFSYCGI
jgi:hypothetical protein